jgi:tRNA-(ms[2]io[6]A)-hydroxylase
VLELRYRTPLAWAERASREPLRLLSDHAHCEVRAAAAAQGILIHNPEHAGLVDRLSRLAIEEMRHFRRVAALLAALGGALERAGASPYMEGLTAGALPSRGSVLLDRLLLAGLVELRSHERFELLARAAADPRLAELYGELEPSEAGHATLFAHLALELFPAPRVAERADFLCDLEARVMGELAFAPRMHSGVGA